MHGSFTWKTRPFQKRIALSKGCFEDGVLICNWLRSRFRVITCQHEKYYVANAIRIQFGATFSLDVVRCFVVEVEEAIAQNKEGHFIAPFWHQLIYELINYRERFAQSAMPGPEKA